MMYFSCFAGFDYNADASPQLFFDQVMMHGRNSQQRTDRHVVFIHRSVGQRHQRTTILDRLFGFSTDPVQGVHEASFAISLLKRDIDLR